MHVEDLADILEGLRGELTSFVGDPFDRRSVEKYPVADDLVRDLYSGATVRYYSTYYLREAFRYHK